MGRNTSTEEKDSIIPRDRDINPERSISFEVPYARSSINKCRCSQCPVQIDSKCVKDKLESSKTEMAKIPAGEVPDPKDVPGIYCSTGKATCQDLNPDKQCICNTCDVWKEYDLEKATSSQYFCQNGIAT